MPKDLSVISVLSRQRKLTSMNVRIDPTTRVVSVGLALSEILTLSDGRVTVNPTHHVSPTPAQIAVILTPALHDAVSTLAHQLADEASA